MASSWAKPHEPGHHSINMCPTVRPCPTSNLQGRTAAGRAVRGLSYYPTSMALRTCERSAMHHAPWARMRAFSFLSLHEEKLKKVGQ